VFDSQMARRRNYKQTIVGIIPSLELSPEPIEFPFLERLPPLE
jgi:hypothetical protein